MAKTVYPPQVQAMLDTIKKAKQQIAEQRELELSCPTHFSLTVAYMAYQVEQELTVELSHKSELGVWKEAERFLREFFFDDDYSLIKAEIYEYHKPKYETTDLFFIWRQL